MNMSNSYEALRSGAGWFEPERARYIALSGTDRVEWLQGQITNDLRGLAPGDTIGGCLCSATGQLLAILRIWTFEDSLVVGCNGTGADRFLERCADMVILEDVVASEIIPTRGVLSIQGPLADEEVFALFGAQVASCGLSADGTMILRHDRSGRGGWDLLLQRPWESDLPHFEPSTVEIARIEAGIPLEGVDTTPKTLPPELGPAFEEEHISYRKGCYTGQEVLMRIHSRGHTNKTWVGVRAEAEVLPGDPVRTKDGRDVGQVTSAAVSPALGPIAAATVRNEALSESEVVVGAKEIAAVLQPMPLLRS
jgi:folate-binding protein YgfZ